MPHESVRAELRALQVRHRRLLDVLVTVSESPKHWAGEAPTSHQMRQALREAIAQDAHDEKIGYVAPTKNVTDALEQVIQKALEEASGYEYEHEVLRPTGRRLDFYLVNEGVFIEVKRFHSDRSEHQLQSATDVILVQGERATHFLAELLRLKGETDAA